MCCLLIPGNDPISLNPPTASVDDPEIIVNITLDASPAPLVTIKRMDGMPISDKDTRVTIGADTIVLQNLTSADAVTYNVTATNAAGNQTAMFSLCEFELCSANCALPIYSHVQYIHSYIHTDAQKFTVCIFIISNESPTHFIIGAWLGLGK